MPRLQVETVLKAAVRKLSESKEDVVLENPIVHILELGDYSITYRVSALLKNVEKLITVRSLLRCYLVDALHEANIEIVSPVFMNQRQFPPKRQFTPTEYAAQPPDQNSVEEVDLEELSLTKSKLVGKAEAIRMKRKKLETEIEKLKEKQKEADEQAAADIEKEIAKCQRNIERIDAALKSAEA